MRKNFILVVTLAMALSLFIAFATFNYKSTNLLTPTPVFGMVDLSKWNFATDGAVNLNGEWSFYFNQFLTHEDFEKDLAGKATPIMIPSTKKSIVAANPNGNNKFYGTMRLVVKLPPQTKVYGLRTNLVLYSYELFIDGELAGSVGKVGESKQTSFPYINIMNTYFTPKNGELEIIYHTSDFYVGDCAIAAPRIGLSEQISRESQMNLGRDLFLFGMLLIMGIYHFGLYVMRRKDRAPLYFGIFCLSFALRMLIVGERYLPSVVNLPLMLYARLAYATVFIGFSALCGFVYHALKELFPKWFINLSAGAGITTALLAAFLPYPILDVLLIIYAVIGFPLLGFAIVRLFFGVWDNYPSASGVLIGFICLGAAFVNDFIYQLTLSNRASMIPLGVAVFTFIQAYTLSTRFANSFTRAEQLSDENAAILSELKHVNNNLEMIVDSRTLDLTQAMVELDIMSKTDYLTKLPNRRLIFQKLDQFIEEEQDFFIAIADIDKFKFVNDTYGHDVGDQILRDVSTSISMAVGNDGFIGRWGGEEFLIVLLTKEPESALKMANILRETVSNCRYDKTEAHITLTIGLCQYAKAIPLDICIANADSALFVGKANGRNQSQLFSY